MGVQFSDGRGTVVRTVARQEGAESGGDAAAYALLKLAATEVLGNAEGLEVLQLSGRGGIAAFNRRGERLVFKLMTCQSRWRKRLARLFGWNPARRAHHKSVTLESAGIPACPVIEYGGIRLPAAPRSVWTISRFYARGMTLRAYKRELQPSRRSAEHPEIRALCSAGIRVLRQLHEAGFQHLDFHAGNLLVVPNDKRGSSERAAVLRLLDLDTVVRRRPFVASRARELCRFIQNFVEPQNYREVIQGALEEYADGDERMLSTLRRSRPVKRLLRMRGVQQKDIVRARIRAAA